MKEFVPVGVMAGVFSQPVSLKTKPTADVTGQADPAEQVFALREQQTDLRVAVAASFVGFCLAFWLESRGGR